MGIANRLGNAFLVLLLTALVFYFILYGAATSLLQIAGPYDRPADVRMVAFSLPGVGEIRVGTHAEARHGEDAWMALRAAQACGLSCLYRCPGDKWYYTGHIGRKYFTVVGYGKALATAFITDRDISRRLADDHCRAETIRLAGHDGMTGSY